MDLHAEHDDGFSPCLVCISSHLMSAFKYKFLYMKYIGFFIIMLEILKMKIKSLAIKR